ncbi:MAG: DUF1269 domain-containing protein [Propionicimonas sp.]
MTEEFESPTSGELVVGTPAGSVPDVDQDGTAVAEADVIGAVISDGAYTLFVADFDEEDSAWAAYQSLKSAQDGVTVKIEGVVVVKRDEHGKVSILKATDHSTKKGLKWGVIGGAALGVIFPPSILAGAAVMGAIGAASGKARELHHRGKLADDLETAILPGHSGIIAMVSNPGAVKIRAALAAANAIVQSTVDDVAAREIKAAAKAAKRESKTT